MAAEQRAALAALFGGAVCFTILVQQGDLSPAELSTLLDWSTVKSVGNPLREWLPDPCWSAVEKLSAKMETFETLAGDLEEGALRWRDWFHSQQPENERMPQHWKDIPPFHKLLVLRALRPDRMVHATREYVAMMLAPELVASVPFQLDVVYQELSPSTPLLFLLSPGVDPFTEIKHLGAQFGITEANGRLQVVSLGQGQELVAEEAMDQAQFNGNWVALQNIHNMASWLPTLALKLEELGNTNAHPSLRIFLSAAAPPAGERACSNAA